MSIPNPRIIFEKIEEFDSIITVGHIRPDGDAYGSSVGMKLAIDGLYANKKTYAVLDDVPYVPNGWLKPIKPGKLPLNVIKKSLVIIMDTSTSERIADQRLLKGAYIIKIDHHPSFDHYGDVEFVDDKKCANALILADILFSKFPVLPKNASEALLLGIITDSGNFRFTNDGDAFAKAGRLIDNGADIKSIYDTLYTSSLDDIKTKSYLYSKMEFSKVLAYSIFTLDDLEKLNKKADEVATLVNTIGFTKEYPVWAYFAEYPNHKFRAELRCNDKYDVSETAIKIGGGGHKEASGAQLNSLEDVKKAINLLSNIKPVK